MVAKVVIKSKQITSIGKQAFATGDNFPNKIKVWIPRTKYDNYKSLFNKAEVFRNRSKATIGKLK